MMTADLLAPPARLGTALEYCCPQCRGELSESPDRYDCATCSREYPIVLGIPDFRVFADPYIGPEEDREKAHRLAEHYDRCDFRGLVEHYWSNTPNTPPDLARRYVRHALTGVDRGRQSLRMLLASRPRSGSRFLEMGCGTGGFLAAARESFDEVVGIDIALRWLIVARKHLDELGIQARLACCCAEHLPFRAGAFDLAVASDVLEHTRFQRELLTEAHRALRPGGAFHAATPNRLSLTPEPHVRVWGVGWLPRTWRKPYVRFVRGLDYEHVHLLSRGDLLRLAAQTPFGDCEIRLPTFSPGEQEGLSRWERLQIAAYHRMKSWPGMHAFLLRFGPVLHLRCVRGDDA